MHFITKDNIRYELEVLANDDVIAYNLDRSYLKDQELIFEGLWRELRSDAIADCRYHIGDGDYDWDEPTVIELATSNLAYYANDSYELGDFKLKIN